MEDCKFLNECNSCTLKIPYNEQISLKKSKIKSHFLEFYDKEFEIFTTKDKNFRSRAEFGIFHDKNGTSYTMNGKNTKFLQIDECLIVDEKITNLMPKLIKQINQNHELKHKLFGVEFITSKNEILVILLYHKNVNEIKPNLEILHKNLNLNLIARSRGIKLVFGSEILNEELMICGKKFRYVFSDCAFIQPNRNMNEMMIEWALNQISNAKDLLELYCGHGNFTIPLSFKFDKVLATEISKKSIQNALKNCELNGASNIKFVRISSEELMQAINKEREFFRLREIRLMDYDFSHILVDPPRAGCDLSVLNFIKNYPNIIYISCNPETLKRDLGVLCKTHEIVKFAIFDQFAHTNHIESGVYLKAKL